MKLNVDFVKVFMSELASEIKILNFVIALVFCFLCFIILYLVEGFLIELLPDYGFSILIFFIIAGTFSILLLRKFTIGKNPAWVIASFFLGAMAPLVRFFINIKLTRKIIFLVFLSGIILWFFESALIMRMSIGVKECEKGVICLTELKNLGLSIKIYQSDYKDFYPQSLFNLYQNKNAVKFLEFTFDKANKEYFYVAPEKNSVPSKQVIAYLRKPMWHFHSLNKGSFYTYALFADGNVKSIEVPATRYSGNLRRIFFWYFFDSPFKGPQELTYDEVNRYLNN